jgi:hypothetical protein
MIDAYLAKNTSEPPQPDFSDGHLLRHMDFDPSVSAGKVFTPVGDGTHTSFDGGVYVMVSDSYVPIIPQFEWTPENLAKVNAGTKRKAEDDEDIRKFGVGLGDSFGYNDGDDEMDTGVGARRKKAIPKRRRDLGINYPRTDLATSGITLTATSEPVAFTAGGNGTSSSSRPDAFFNSSSPNRFNLRSDANTSFDSEDALMRSFDSNSSAGG